MPALNSSSAFGWHASDKSVDPLERMAQEDRNDWVLLRLVVCAAAAMMALAVASTLPL
jgi:hypothetical protein